MDLKEISQEAKRIKKLYAEHERNKFGREWNREEVFIGLVTDIGDLGRLVLAKEGMMQTDDLKGKVEHEISDCLWALLTLANEYGVDVEKTFVRDMQLLEERIKKDDLVAVPPGININMS